MRHGIGTCTWADGSTYTGDWTQNLRHGNGIFKTGGDQVVTYQGQFANDIKHGRGKLTYANGETIIGHWENDRINGIARV